MRYRRALCFGTFDPLHYGHIRLFERAHRLADKVFAVAEAGSVIQAEKGREPLSSDDDRLKDLRAIKYLSGVAIRTEEFDRETWVKIIDPDVLIVGSDHEGKWTEGEKLGVPIVYLKRTEGISSTTLRDTL